MKSELTPNLVRVCVLGLALLSLSLNMGCSTVGIHEQRLVSKPNMQFSDSAVFDYSSKVLPQVEPGTAASGGAAAAGCTSCR